MNNMIQVEIKQPVQRKCDNKNIMSSGYACLPIRLLNPRIPVTDWI